MATHPGMLLAYQADGTVILTRDVQVMYDPDGVPLGLVDFAGHEEAGGEMTDIWTVESKINGVDDGTVKGSKAWPEWIGGRAAEFRVELTGPPGKKRITALVHNVSGHRRERAAVESAVAARIVEAAGEPADIRDLVGGPDRPLPLDDHGRNIERVVTQRPSLPLVVLRLTSDEAAGAEETPPAST
jgi:hypothetical protein